MLVVEDELLIAMDISMTLEDGGHEVVGTARTADEAIALAGQESPDIVLMDLNLADGTRGDDAARAILRRYGIRSIFVSGSIDEEAHQALAAVDPVCMLIKPIQPKVLLGALEVAVAG